MSRRLALALTPLALPLLLTGCSLPGGSGGPGGSDAATGADGRLALAMLQPPRSRLSPLSDDAFKLSRWSTAETLVVLDEAGDPQPGLATTWQQVEPTTWRLSLRDGVRFHDGAVLDADAAVGSLTAAATAAPLPRILDGVEMTAVASGPLQVDVTTAVADPLLPQRLSSPQLAVLSPGAYDGGAGAPVDPVGTGSGPFELVTSNGTTGATLDRFDGYWGEPARLDGIDVTYVPDGTARTAALRTGTADVVEAVPAGQAEQVDADLLHEVAMPRTNTLYLDTAEGAFRDPALRAAAREALDPRRVVDDVYDGRADLAAGLLGPALPWAAPLREDDAYGAEVADRAAPATDVAAAAAGPITLATFTDRAELPEVAVLLEQQLEAAGFEVEQVVREYQFIEADALAGAFDAFILSRATVLDSGDPVAYLTSDFSCTGSFNLSRFCDADVDAALADAAAQPTGDGRRAAVARVESMLLARDAAVPMLHERVLQGEGPGVSGVERDPRERALITARTTLG